MKKYIIKYCVSKDSRIHDKTKEFKNKFITDFQHKIFKASCNNIFIAYCNSFISFCNDKETYFDYETRAGFSHDIKFDFSEKDFLRLDKRQLIGLTIKRWLVEVDEYARYIQEI